MDIGGTKNSIKAITLENVKQHLDWYDEDWGTSEYQQQIVHRPIKTEDEGKMDYGTNSGGMYVIQSEKTNAWGVPRGVSERGSMLDCCMVLICVSIIVRHPSWGKQHPSHQPQCEADPSQRRVGEALAPRHSHQGLGTIQQSFSEHQFAGKASYV
jgi:primary-amine oxidase